MSAQALRRQALVLCLILSGCSSKPRAPELRDEPVYENSQEGLRFLAPENWTQYARAVIPSGKVEKERLLVAYRSPEGKDAIFEVSRADLPESTSFAEYLSGPAFSAKAWRLKGRSEELEIDGTTAVRFIFVTGAGKDERVREAVTVRRGERCYFFNGVYFTGDVKARDEIRRSVASILWKD